MKLTPISILNDHILFQKVIKYMISFLEPIRWSYTPETSLEEDEETYTITIEWILRLYL